MFEVDQHLHEAQAVRHHRLRVRLGALSVGAWERMESRSGIEVEQVVHQLQHLIGEAVNERQELFLVGADRGDTATEEQL